MTDEIGDGTGNEILVTGALFAMLAMPYASGVLDVTLSEDTPNAVEFGLDFMHGRYRATITKLPDDE